MSEQVIQTKRGTYGRVQVTLPMVVKETMYTWLNRSGMRKAEFFRHALMMGVVKLADQMNAIEPGEGYYSNNSDGRGDPRERGYPARQLFSPPY